MLIAMAGLPGTGKTTLAARLAVELGAVVLNKDAVRAVLFPPAVLDYSAGQDDVSMAAVYSAAAHILRTQPHQTVILDGRTFSRLYQVRDLLALATSIGKTPHIIECVCTDEVARARLEDDQARDAHPAENRTFALYLERKATVEPILPPRLILDTGVVGRDECIRRCIAWLRCG